MAKIGLNRTAICYFVSIIFSFLTISSQVLAQSATLPLPKNAKKISTDLFGLFFEDINYAADGGLYAELVQNRSFEYNPAERSGWNPLSFWEYQSTGFSYGKISIETGNPVHPNNPHYVVIEAEHIRAGGSVGLKNLGYDGMVVKAGEQYNFALFAAKKSNAPVSILVTLQSKKGDTLSRQTLSINQNRWTKYEATLTSSQTDDSAVLVVAAISEGVFAMDMVSLFPEKTFKNRKNGLRNDLAQPLAAIQPRFVRFPGGCLAHGDGLGNMYRWKNTIGPIEQRVEQRNIWGYHQTAGLGYFEYFQFCEDIGAKPLPVLPAGVSCQNSGGTWRIGGVGQKALPMESMNEYVQEVLDLIEWANGPTSSTWGAKRAAAGHPSPFNLQYIGIGNEDKITPEFEERFSMIFKAVKQKHPEITVIGTSGPFSEGEDYEKGWKIVNNLKVPVVDEHYYQDPAWFISNQYRYDKYNRTKAKVYLGEYASWGNALKNALAEALYMIGLERNGDIVSMASYAPLLAKKNYTQWKTDMIFFDNKEYVLTPNYHVQKLFGNNQGDYYLPSVFTSNEKDSLVAASAVFESKSGDIILKMVNLSNSQKTLAVNLSGVKQLSQTAAKIILKGEAAAVNTFDNKNLVEPLVTSIKVSKKFVTELDPMSFVLIRIKTTR